MAMTITDAKASMPKRSDRDGNSRATGGFVVFNEFAPRHALAEVYITRSLASAKGMLGAVYNDMSAIASPEQRERVEVKRSEILTNIKTLPRPSELKNKLKFRQPIPDRNTCNE